MTPVKRLKRLVFELEYFFLFQISCIYIYRFKKNQLPPPFQSTVPNDAFVFCEGRYIRMSALFWGEFYSCCVVLVSLVSVSDVNLA